MRHLDHLVRAAGALSLALLVGWASAPQPALAAAPADSLRKAAAASGDIGRRFALVIGNASYESIPSLRNPVNDSRAICESLRALQFQTDCRHDIADRRTLREAVRELRKKLRPEDVALFYFAGHGIEVDGENFLVPTKATMPDRSYVEDEALRLSYVFEELRESKVRLSIVMLDACRDNPFGKTRSLGTKGGLSAPSTVPAGSIIIFPTAPGQVAYDGSGNNGLFTSHLLKHLNTPGVTVEEMFKRVIDGVRADSSRRGQEQVPWMNLSFTGEFCFVGCGTRVSADQYMALIQEKQQIEKLSTDLQGQLAERRNEVAEFRRRMSEMETRLLRQQSDRTLNADQQRALASERAEHTASVARLRDQEAELARLNTELERVRQVQGELLRKEKDLTVAHQRIGELERQLQLSEDRRITLASSEIEKLRREHQALLAQRQNEGPLRQELTDARARLERLQTTMATVERQQRELEAYRERIARLESDSQSKDQTLAAMRADLATRESELNTVRDRLSALQSQLVARSQDRKISESVMTGLRQERDALVESSRLLAERERELTAVREQLRKLESTRSGSTPQEVVDLRERLARYDRQQSELNTYKSRLADAEKRLTDAAAAAVRGAAFVAPSM